MKYYDIYWNGVVVEVLFSREEVETYLNGLPHTYESLEGNCTRVWVQ